MKAPGGKRMAATATLLLGCLWSADSLAAQQPTALERARTELAAGRFEQASTLYREVLRGRPKDPQVLGELVDALEAAGSWRDAVEYLSQLVRLDPHNAARFFQLARYLSWLPERRDEARALLEQLVAAHPANISYRLAYAELLSWDRRRRSQAVAVYEEILRDCPEHIEARLRYAELLSWQGRLRRAEQIYQAVVRRQPQNAETQIGLAEVFAWSGRSFAALLVLAKVPAGERNARWHLARASSYFDLGRRGRAAEELKQALGEQPENHTARDLLGEIQDWRRTHAVVGFEFIRGSGDPTTTRLGYDRPSVTVRFPANAWSRVEFSYAATEFFNALGRVREHRAGLGWEGQPTDDLRIAGRIEAAKYPRGPVDVTGEAMLGWRASDLLDIETRVTRGVLLDSLQAAAGVSFNGQGIGRARLTLGYARLRWRFARHNLELAVRPSYGAVTGLNLETNYRTGADAWLTKAWRLAPEWWGEHYLRAGFAFSWFAFEEDLGGFFKGAPERNSGGYFSPTAFYNYTGLTALSGRLGRRWSYAGEVRLGVQHGERVFGELDPRLSSYVALEQSLRISDHWQLLGRYEFIDVAGAFRRHRGSFGVRFDP